MVKNLSKLEINKKSDSNQPIILYFKKLKKIGFYLKDFSLQKFKSK